MRWRLLVDGHADGAVNMAADEALLDWAGESSIATLRVYHFAEPTLTFGYGQRLAAAADIRSCRAHGVPYVRRITGGRALLHQHELTFAVAAPARTDDFDSVRGAYASVSGAIAGGLRALGVPVDRETVPAPDTASPRGARHRPCLSAPSAHEITVAGQKLVAAAQRFRRSSFLVHGAILWRVDRELAAQLVPSKEESEIRAVGLGELDIPRLEEHALIESLAASFAELFGAAPSRSERSLEEKLRVDVIAETYRSEAWTRRVE